MEFSIPDNLGDLEPEIVRLWMLAVVLSPVRMLTAFVVLPMFARAQLSVFIRSTLAIGLSITIMPAIAQMLAEADLATGMFALLVLKEAVIGLLIALPFGVLFWSFDAAGNFLDFQRGASMAINSTSPDQSLVTGSFLGLIFGTLFIVSGGLQILVDIIYQSIEIWSPVELLPAFNEELLNFTLGLLDRMFSIGVVVAGPIMIAMLISELGLAFLTRAAPQLNVFIVALGVKSGVLFLILPIYLIFLVDRFNYDVGEFQTLIERLKGVFQ